MKAIKHNPLWLRKNFFAFHIKKILCRLRQSIKSTGNRMFQNLSDKLKKIFDKLAGRGLLTTDDVDQVARDIRIALLEADVALPVVKQILASVKDKAVGEEVLKGLRPDQVIIKLVNDALLEALGPGEELNLRTQPPAVILMAGLQGSGKTTTAAKLAKHLKDKHNKKCLLVSGDIYRPAAQEQLQTNAGRVGVDFLPIEPNEKPLAIAKRALAHAKKSGYDVLIYDTAGRLELDEALMQELKDVHAVLSPIETLFVADSLMGQTAATVAKGFNEAVGITGIVLTRIDGDSRGGAALSARAVTGCPLKFLGVGEGLDALQPFAPERLANRILGMGDVVELVERMQSAVSHDEAASMAEQMQSGGFNLTMMRQQLGMMSKMGSLAGMLDLIPGMGKLKDKIDPSTLDDKMVVHQMAIIDSMTVQERQNPGLMNAKRRLRIAGGAGVTVHEVNKLLKSFTQMQDMMKKMQSGGKKGLMQSLFKGM